MADRPGSDRATAGPPTEADPVGQTDPTDQAAHADPADPRTRRPADPADQAALPDRAGPAASDLAEVSARFGAALREAGLPVGPGRCERFAAAVTVARPGTPRALYLCALATLVSSRDQALILRAVFDQVFGGLSDGGEAASLPARPVLAACRRRRLRTCWPARPRPPSSTPSVSESRTPTPTGRPARTRRRPEAENRYLGTATERLASKDFAELSDDELVSVATLMRRLTLAVPDRQSRRQRRRPGGRRTDMRSTLRQARRTGGHAFRLIGRTPARRPRRLVVLCDISGSMEPYARAMIQLLYCAAGGASAEVFTFATRLTRLTPVLGRIAARARAAAGRPGRPRLAGRHQDRRGAQGVQRSLRPARHGARRGRRDHLRRLGDRRP